LTTFQLLLSSQLLYDYLLLLQCGNVVIFKSLTTSINDLIAPVSYR